MNKDLQDKAWVALPKEFREEVKKYYIECIEEMKLYTTQYSEKLRYYSLFIYLFGEHNLTSDTEGEEMLIISRKAAEEFYNKYLGDSMQAVNRLTLRKDINILFGGKCRGGEDDVIKTELKFKVGDKVKILSDGRTGTITSIKEGPTPYFVVWNNTQGIAGGHLSESDIKLYSEEKSEKRFLVGKKVLISDDPRIGKDFRGRIGTVVFICSSDKRIVDVSNGVVPECFHISHLAPVPEPKSAKLKLKRGDKVRIIKKNHPLYGEIAVVDSLIKDAVNDKVYIKCCHSLLTFHESDLEPYSELQTSNADENAENKKQTTVNLSTSSDNQLRIMVAAEAMKGILQNPNIIMSCGCLDEQQKNITKHAVEYADALLAEINGKGGGDERNNN